MLKALVSLADALAGTIQESGLYMATTDDTYLPCEVSLYRKPVVYNGLSVKLLDALNEPHILSCDTAEQATLKCTKATKYYTMKTSDLPKNLQLVASIGMKADGHSSKVPLKSIAKYYMKQFGKPLHMGDLAVEKIRHFELMEVDSKDSEEDLSHIFRPNPSPRTNTETFVPLEFASVDENQAELAPFIIYVFRLLASTGQVSNPLGILFQGAAEGLKKYSPGTAPDPVLQVKLILPACWYVMLSNLSNLLDTFLSGGVTSNLEYIGELFAEAVGGKSTTSVGFSDKLNFFKVGSLRKFPLVDDLFDWKTLSADLVTRVKNSAFDEKNGGGSKSGIYCKTTALNMLAGIIQRYKYDMPEHYFGDGSFENKYPGLEWRGDRSGKGSLD